MYNYFYLTAAYVHIKRGILFSSIKTVIETPNPLSKSSKIIMSSHVGWRFQYRNIQTPSGLRQERNESTNLFNIFRDYNRRMHKDICEEKGTDTLRIPYHIANECIDRKHHSASSHGTNGHRMTWRLCWWLRHT